MDEEFEPYEDDLETHGRDEIARDNEDDDQEIDDRDAAEDAAEWESFQDYE